MSVRLQADSVTLDYPIYDASALSLRTSMFSYAVGGQLFRSRNIPVVRALSNVSLRLEDGDRLGLVGHNGSGKTTLLKTLAGILEPSSGRVQAYGPITSTIAFGAGLDTDATGIQNVYKLAIIRGVSRREITRSLDSIIEFSGLAQFAKLPVRTYSAGMTARLIFAVTTAFDPQILIMDEWLGAGDADFMAQAQIRMQSFVDKASVLVLASHNLHLIHTVCNKVCHMDNGQVAFLGSTAEWLERQAQAQAA